MYVKLRRATKHNGMVQTSTFSWPRMLLSSTVLRFTVLMHVPRVEVSSGIWHVTATNVRWRKNEYMRVLHGRRSKLHCDDWLTGHCMQAFLDPGCDLSMYSKLPCHKCIHTLCMHFLYFETDLQDQPNLKSGSVGHIYRNTSTSLTNLQYCAACTCILML